MTIDKTYWAELLKEIYPECHDCKYLIEVDYLDGDGMDNTGLICNEEHDGLIFIWWRRPKTTMQIQRKGERIMTVDEDYKIIYAEMLEDIYPECHDCKHLYLDYEYYENLDDEFPFFECFKNQPTYNDEEDDDPRPPCKYREKQKSNTTWSNLHNSFFYSLFFKK